MQAHKQMTLIRKESIMSEPAGTTRTRTSEEVSAPIVAPDGFPVERRLVAIKGTEPPDSVGPGDLAILERKTLAPRSLLRLAETLAARGATGLIIPDAIAAELGEPERRAIEDSIPLLTMGENWKEASERLLRGPMEVSTDPDDVLRALLQGRFIMGPLPAHLEAGSAVRAIVFLAHPEERVHVPLSKLEEVVAAEALLRDPRSHAVTVDGLVTALVGDYDYAGEEDGIGQALMHRVQAALLIGKLTVGVGRAYSGLEGLRRTFREATWASRCAELLGQGNRVVSFRELGIYGMLEPFVGDPSTADTEDVEKLIDYDKQNQTALLPTLEAFFEAGASGDAAAMLFVHRNTVAYRLRAVKRITGLDVREADARLLLEIQLRLARIRGLLPARSSGLPRRSRRGRR